MVSIIIPAYNAHNFLRATLMSIQAQSVSDWEVIVWDDGSSPPLESIVKSFSEPRFSYFYAFNSGVSASRNQGFEKSKGEYIVFFDSDDLMGPDFLSSRVNKLNSSADIDFVCADALVMDESGNTGEKWLVPVCENLVKDILHYELPYCEKISCPSNYLFRRKVIEDIKFDVTLQSSADRLFLLDLSANYQGLDLGRKGILYYRRSANSMSAKKDISFYQDNYRYFKLVRARKDHIPANSYRKFCFGHGKILAYGFLKNGKLFRGIQFLFISTWHNPIYYWNKLKTDHSRSLKQMYEIPD